MVRETWTDERLDDLKAGTERGFDGVKGEIREVRGEIGELRGEIRELRTETNARFDSMQRTMIIGFATLFASVVGSVVAGVLAAILVT